MFFNNLKRYFLFFWNSKKIWTKPKKAKVLIYDYEDSEIFLNYLNPDDVEFLFIRGKTYNLYIFFKLLIKRKIPTITNYIVCYINTVKPSLVLTFIDNSFTFYLLKSSCKNIKTIFVQSGLRSVIGDIFNTLENEKISPDLLSVDYMLVYNSSVGKKYLNYINGTMIPIGSIKSNFVPYKKGNIKKSNLIFISQFRPKINKEGIFFKENDITILWDDFYSVDIKILKYLKEFCKKNKLKLQICAMSFKIHDDEFKFYSDLLGDSNWEYLSRENVLSSYEYIDRAEFVVSVDSTLGYESFARGNKTAIFSCRSFGGIDKPIPFGWPTALPDHGPFWTNHCEKKDLDRVMNKLLKVTEGEWKKIRLKYMPFLMEYDPRNTIFINLLKELGAPLKSDL